MSLSLVPNFEDAHRPPRSRAFSLDRGMQPVSNASSGVPGGVTDDEVEAHPGIPGTHSIEAAQTRRTHPRRVLSLQLRSTQWVESYSASLSSRLRPPAPARKDSRSCKTASL